MKKRSIISPFAIFSAFVFLAVMIIYVISRESSRFAELINSTLSFEFRKFMAGLGDLFEFSLAEYIVLFSPLLIALVVFLGYRSLSSGKGARFLVSLVAFILLLYSGHTLALGVAYNAEGVGEKMGLSSVEVTKEGLEDALRSLTSEVNELSQVVPRNGEGVFSDPRSNAKLSELLCESYSDFSEEWGAIKTFDSTAKSVRHGSLMSYLRITGIYTYFTGEANVNSAYPSYDFIFTSAHEMAHQRGVLRENEANFVAYVVTSTSQDASLRYSAALSMYEYIASALYKTDKDSYYAIYEELSPLAINDIRASSAVTRAYGDTFIGDISEKINDIFLKSNGTSGVISYSQVVRLALAYFETEK